MTARSVFRYAWMFPVVITVLMAGVHVWWLAADQVALFWDTARHGANVLTLLEVAQQSELSILDRARMIYAGTDAYYPPFFYQVALPVVMVLGRSADSIALTNLVFLLLLNVSVFSMARRAAGLRYAWLAPLLASCSPMLFDFAHQVMLDFALTAMTAAALALLMNRPFLSWRRAALLGVTLGLGFLTKWTYPAFVVLPVAWTFLLARRFKQQVLPGVVCLIMTLLVAREWMVIHQNGLMRTSEAATHVPGLQGLSVMKTLEFLSFIPRFQLDAFGALVAAISIFMLLRSPRRRRVMPLVLCVLSSAGAWGILGKHQDPRYSLPQLAALVPMMACLPALFPRHGRILAAALTAWCGLLLVNLCLAPSVLNFESLTWLRPLAQHGYHQGPPAVRPREEPLVPMLQHIAAGSPAPDVTFDSKLNVQGIDSFAVMYYTKLLGVRLADEGGRCHIHHPAAPVLAGDEEVLFDSLRAGVPPVQVTCAKADSSLWHTLGEGAGVWKVTAADAAGMLRVNTERGPRDVLLLDHQSAVAVVGAGEVLQWNGAPAAAHLEPLRDNGAGRPALRIPFHVVNGQAEPPRISGGASQMWLAGPYMVLPAGSFTVRLVVSANLPLTSPDVLAMRVHGTRKAVSTLSTALRDEGKTLELALQATLLRGERDIEFHVQTQGLPGETVLTAESLELVVADVSTLQRVVRMNLRRLPGAAVFPLHPVH